MPRLIAMALLAWLLPLRVAAQADVIVFLEEASPLRPSFEVELAARGWRAVFEPPNAHPPQRTVELGAIGSVWLEPGLEDGVTLRAFRTDRGTGAGLAVSQSEDPRMLALVAAAMLEDLLSQDVAPVSVPEPVARRSYPRWLGPYTAVELGGWLRLRDPLEDVVGHVGARLAIGVQWGTGLRIGALGAVEGYSDVGPSYGSQSIAPSGGVEVGARLGDATWAFHFGAQALVGESARHARAAGLELLFGAYIGAGIWVTPRVELGLRLTGEASIQPTWTNSAVFRLALHAEFR